MTNFNLIQEIRKHIIHENDIQNAEAIEYSLSGELVPMEIAEGKFEEFIKLLKGKLCDCGSIFNPNNMDGECNLCQAIDEFARKKKPITIMSAKKVDDSWNLEFICDVPKDTDTRGAKND